ncbi:MAG: hypothetical protein ABIH86_02410 [Planctomycetota bacterium]
MAEKFYHSLRIRHIAYAYLFFGILLFVEGAIQKDGRLWVPIILIVSAAVLLVVDFRSNRKRRDDKHTQIAETDDKDAPTVLQETEDSKSEILRLKDRVQELEQTLGSRTATDVPESLNSDVSGASSLDPDFLEELETSDPKGSDPGIAGDFTPIGGSKAQSTQSEPNGSETKAPKKDNEDS